jgi:hypothetical protein
MARCLSLSLTTFLLASLILVHAHAAELGEARVSSHIGQQLVADMELTALDDAAAQVQVRLANPDVYRGANIAMPAVLSSMTMSVMQRDGRQFLHVTSLKPVESEHLHLYLELVDGGRRSVRLSTLWLTPDPNPAPPPAPRIAEPIPRLSEPAPPVEVPAPAPVRAIARVPARVPAARLAHLPPPLPLPAAKPVACIPQVSPEARACIALDAKNAALKDQIGLLENKVKGLQVAMTATPAAAAVHAGQAAPARPAVPRRVPRKPVKADDSGLPWLEIGAGAVALLAAAGGAMLAVRRRNETKAKAARGGIKSRLMPN